jgi:hypothetical protein
LTTHHLLLTCLATARHLRHRSGGGSLTIIRAVSRGVIGRRDFVIAVLLRQADRKADDQGDQSEGGDAQLEKFLFNHF